MAESSTLLGCVRRFGDFNITAPGANTGIITGGIRFSRAAVACRLTIALTTASVVNVTCTDGTTTHKWGLDKSVALNAADLYAYTFAVLSESDDGDALTYNIEVETDGVIEKLIVEEVTGGVV